MSSFGSYIGVKVLEMAFRSRTQRNFMLHWTKQLNLTKIRYLSASQLIASVLLNVSQFNESDIVTEFRGKEFKFTMYSRNLRDAVQSIVGDPDLFDYLRLDAERVTVRHPDGTRNMRVYEEYWQGDDMWDLQVSRLLKSCVPRKCDRFWASLQLDQIVGHFLSLYMPMRQHLPRLGTLPYGPFIFGWGICRQVSGQREERAVLFLLATYPRCVTFIRYAQFIQLALQVNNQAGLTKAQHSELRDLVYHQCFRILFQSIEVSSTVGDVFMFGDGRSRHCTTPVAALPNDYPELYVFHLSTSSS
jgi:Plavaka transposase